ncbi:arginine decarboxylase, pyruvoyl-dependent [Nocardioides koreensis]|uniref:Pyruvoyl-dependent arginine decarboxylase AaxB n=1 Tax=Nocardioides koreensis TaxID=433651 RepID=A0ABP5KY57_9ACTN
MEDQAGPDITIRTGSGQGHTKLSAFDHALLTAGVANFNLVTLSSVIPPRSRIRLVDTVLPGGHGDRLYCVLAAAHAEHPGETVWAGLGWVCDETGKGLFVEHTAGSEESLREQIELSLDDLTRNRGGGYGPVQTVTASAHYVDRPACALAIAAYEVSPWGPGA